MRYTETQREESRAKILTAAAEQFRQHGYEAVRVADVMDAAGLTVGGFYKHFADKDELFTEALAAALDALQRQMLALTEGKTRGAALAAVIEFYLSEGHVEHPEAGCVLAALGTELVRFPAPLRAAVTRTLKAYAQRLNFLMPGASFAERGAAARVLFASMAGCVMTTRALESRAQRRELLRGARTMLLTMYGASGKRAA